MRSATCDRGSGYRENGREAGRLLGGDSSSWCGGAAALAKVWLLLITVLDNLTGLLIFLISLTIQVDNIYKGCNSKLFPQFSGFWNKVTSWFHSLINLIYLYKTTTTK